ncbi:hypothetical protein [Caldivirga maquilingensis]|uniref:Uncharacterized protein n=1 Tax=Caldivirga maquilingensis (strain ATCC 700844 / DSM 13496 / JCM 10307 / IC-167) TaxID=397948 RepID=A8MD86_CALMQ|nr:hypothetical protein [Caldivirga maquilingensis]ABW01742.1 hypothetical protein Cmaq_0909 [Caldivirga maquilingensis IC-167]
MVSASTGSLSRYVVYYVILIIITAVLMLLTSVGLYILFIFSIPIAGSLALMLLSDLRNMRGRPWFRGRQANDAAYVTLTLLMSLGLFLVIPSYEAKVALSSLILLVSAVMINRLGSSLSLTSINIGDFLKKLSISIALFSLSALMGLAYRPLMYPFLTSSLAALVLSSTALINAQPGKGAGNAVLYLRNSYGSIVAAFFGLGVFYMVLAIPKSPILNVYVLAVSILLTLALVAYISYRAYVAVSRDIEKIVEEVYEAHKREVKVIQVPELKYFNDAVEDFIKYGRKDKLIAYLSYMMASGGFEYNEVIDVLSSLFNYQYSPDKLYDRFSVEEEITRRINALNDVLSSMTQYEQTKSTYQIYGQASAQQ